MDFAFEPDFNFARHCGLLALFAAVLAISAPLQEALGIGERFALLGALHAAALAPCIIGPARLSPSRSLLFVAVAALLALATARLGLLGYRWLGAPGVTSALCAVLAASAGVGALAYGALINTVLANPRGASIRAGAVRSRPPFDVVWLGATTLGCAAVTALSFAVSREWQAAGVLALALPWWFAFSGGLWCAGHRRAAKIAASP